MNFLKRIFTPTILTISILLLIYIFYKSEITWNGENRIYYLTYYFISLLLIFFSVFTFFISQKIKEYLIIISITLVVTLYLFEGYLSFIEQPSNKQLLNKQLLKEQLYEKQTGNKWDNRSHLEIYNDLKKVNNEISISFHLIDYINKKHSIFPLSGISNSKTIYCNENGYYSTYQSDRYGFNNPNTEWDEKKIEYLLVGDSFVDGACVNRPNDIGSVLRSISNKSVLNLGKAGNGPLIEYATLREYLNPNVKKVIWFYFEGNDLQNLKDEKAKKILINYLNDLNFKQNIKFKQKEIDDLNRTTIIKEFDRKEREKEREKDEKRKKESLKFKILKFIKIYNTRQSITPSPSSAPAEEIKQILQLTRELVEKNNSKLYFVYLPEYYRYKINYDNTNYSLIKNIVNELNIPFIDIHKEVFKKEQNSLKLFPFELPGHYNVEGYNKVAEIIYKLTSN